MINNKDFWIGWYCGAIFISIVFSIALLMLTHFLPNEFEENGRKKLCELKQYEYCNEEELLKIVKKIK